MLGRMYFLATWALAASTQVAAGQATPIAPFQSRLTLQGPGQNSAIIIHRNPLGRPCLDIEAASRAHVINPNVYDHVVSVENKCLQRIKLQVCYFGTDHCIDVEVAGMQRKDTVLGVYPSMKFFRYSYREKP